MEKNAEKRFWQNFFSLVTQWMLIRYLFHPMMKGIAEWGPNNFTFPIITYFVLAPIVLSIPARMRKGFPRDLRRPVSWLVRLGWVAYVVSFFIFPFNASLAADVAMSAAFVPMLYIGFRLFT